jgi:hypothetical protein
MTMTTAKYSARLRCTACASLTFLFSLSITCNSFHLLPYKANFCQWNRENWKKKAFCKRAYKTVLVCTYLWLFSNCKTVAHKHLYIVYRDIINLTGLWRIWLWSISHYYKAMAWTDKRETMEILSTSWEQVRIVSTWANLLYSIARKIHILWRDQQCKYTGCHFHVNASITSATM